MRKAPVGTPAVTGLTAVARKFEVTGSVTLFSARTRDSAAHNG